MGGSVTNEGGFPSSGVLSLKEGWGPGDEAGLLLSGAYGLTLAPANRVRDRGHRCRASFEGCPSACRVLNPAGRSFSLTDVVPEHLGLGHGGAPGRARRWGPRHRLRRGGAGPWLVHLESQWRGGVSGCTNGHVGPRLERRLWSHPQRCSGPAHRGLG